MHVCTFKKESNNICGFYTDESMRSNIVLNYFKID